MFVMFVCYACLLHAFVCCFVLIGCDSVPICLIVVCLV